MVGLVDREWSLSETRLAHPDTTASLMAQPDRKDGWPVPKTVVHVFHDDDDSVVTGTRVAQRILEVAPKQDVEVEVFCFGPAQRRIGRQASEADVTFHRQLDELIAAGVVVGACVNSARADGSEEELTARGLNLKVARDEFVRFTLEGATVISF